MTTRLDRLVVLLETGSTALVRNTAAQQLADIQKQHPHELYNLLARVAPYLRSREWECRVAAGKAIGGIAENVPRWDPNLDECISDVKPEVGLESVKGETGLSSTGADLKQSLGGDDDCRLCFNTFDPIQVLCNGEKLLGSAGKEYDVAREFDFSTAEGIARQKQLVNKRLGLGSEVFDADLIDVDDLAAPEEHKSKGRDSSKSKAAAKLRKLDISLDAKSNENMSPTTGSMDSALTPTEGMSARQLNVLKRKAKASKANANKVRVIDYSQSTAGRKASVAPANGSATPATVKEESDDYFSVTAQPQNESRVVIEHKLPTVSALVAFGSSPEASRVWPFEGLVEILILDLSDPAWETRHGAAIGLREIFRFHGAGAGRLMGLDKAANDKINAAYLEDISLRCVCVFLLDRFGDYVSDQVVAPIRESVAQLLGAALVHMSHESVLRVFQLLQRLVLQSDFGDCGPVWEICHGGMLGIKYFVAVREDIFLSDQRVLDGVIECVLHGLANHDDDVRAVAAATLVPVADQFIALRPSSVQNLIDTLWESLEDLRDDLSASTGSVMDLLSKLFSIPGVLDMITESAENDEDKSFGILIPRLFPFLRHTIRTVRAAVLRALRTFLGIKSQKGTTWISERAMRLIFQNVLFEQVEDIRELSLSVWTDLLASVPPVELQKIYQPSLHATASLLFTPIGTSRCNIAMESNLIIRPSGQTWAPLSTKPEKAQARKSKKKEIEDLIPSQHKPHNLDGPAIRGDIDLVGESVMIRSRISAAKAFGRLMARWPENSLSIFQDIVQAGLVAQWSSPRWLACVVVEESASLFPQGDKVGIILRPVIADLVESSKLDEVRFMELVPFLQTLRRKCQAIENAFVEHGNLAPNKLPILPALVQGEPNAGPEAFSLSSAVGFKEKDFEKLMSQLSSIHRATVSRMLQELRESLGESIDELQTQREVYERRVVSAAASAVLWLGELGNKLNPIIQGIMVAVKTEGDDVLQRRAAKAISQLISICVKQGRTKVSDKLIKNLSAFLCVDTEETPEFHPHHDLEESILSLKREEEKKNPKDVTAFTRIAAEAKIKRAGAQAALEELSAMYGEDLFTKLPKIKECMSATTVQGFTHGFPDNIKSNTSTFGQSIIDELCITRMLLPKLHTALVTELRSIYTYNVEALQCQFSVIRFAAARCFAGMCKADPSSGMRFMIESVLPMVADQHQLRRRQGAIECIYHLVTTLDSEILPYVIFLIVPVMGRMSDSNTDVRLLATETFATLVKLVPLEAGIPDPPDMPETLLAERAEERKFIAQLLDGSKVDAFEIPVAIQADLRRYQQEGVNWLAFLNKYHLHGILCDDMGLGKTLQSICIIASDHYLRAKRFEITQNPEDRALPSLVVCPPTITGHWQQEISTYAPFMKALLYVGNPSDRQRLRNQIPHNDVVITSYDICRNDTDLICKFNYNYCVLDEGHIIKNGKAKVTQAVKRIKAYHRLILSGTPVQNNVLELWSLFDFLMPGFLGTEKFFYDKFAKPIAASRDSKSSSKEQEAGALALEALHKQVLPFVLRRMKEDVLADLPPKIIQDYYCELSPLQKRLYEDFAKQQSKEVREGVETKEGKQHIFKALQYMRKLCNHPGLILQPKHPRFTEISSELKREGSSVWDVRNAPKLAALTDLLVDCGITGSMTGAKSEVEALASGVVSQHRALIFCQVREMLDRIELDVLKSKLPGVTYLRLDGGVEAKDRFGIVEKFNNDPTIDLLLLTTHVGGLGLNLTGADTVIFVEHDWNPMKDLQAMDRAHRIGQKRVVNVYRLITKNTLEEKIMGLQTFKLNIASSIVNQQNAALATMNTDQILDLFNVKDSGAGMKSGEGSEVAVDAEGNPLKKGSKNVLEDLRELWDEKEYEEEYDMGDYLSSLKGIGSGS